MSAQDGPPAGMETKNVPGYVPAQTVNNDHPGHGEFAGKPGYTNTPGIGDPEESTDDKGTTEKPTSTGKTSGSTTTKSSGSAAKS